MAEVFELDDPGDGAFDLFFRPNPGAFRQLIYVPTLWNLPIFLKLKNATARELAREG